MPGGGEAVAFILGGGVGRWGSGEVGVIVFGYSRGAVAGVGCEGRVTAAGRPPPGHGKEKDEEGTENGKDGGEGSGVYEKGCFFENGVRRMGLLGEKAALECVECAEC